jgi:hypothetical protein
MVVWSQLERLIEEVELTEYPRKTCRPRSVAQEGKSSYH